MTENKVEGSVFSADYDCLPLEFLCVKCLGSTWEIKNNDHSLLVPLALVRRGKRNHSMLVPVIAGMSRKGFF